MLAQAFFCLFLLLVGESGIVDQALGESLSDFNKKFTKIGGKKVSKVRSRSCLPIILIV